MTRSVALALVDELLDARRITSVEAIALRNGLSVAQVSPVADGRRPFVVFPDRNPAERVIGICGGAAAVSRAIGVEISRVYRWTYPKARGGTGGLIPSKHQQPLLTFARAEGKVFRPEDFFPLASTAPAPAAEPAAIVSLDDLFDRFHGVACVGRAIGKTTEHAGAMRRRGSIPLEYWPALIAAARNIGLHLDEALLVRIHLTAPAEERAP